LGQTDSERVFALITGSIRTHGQSQADVTAGLVDAIRWLAANVPIYAVNILLSTATDMWALRYPESNKLYILDRRDDPAAPDPGFDLRTKRIHAASEQLSARPSVVFASQPMDDDPRWRLLDSGELVHVNAELQVTRGVVLPDPPTHLLRPEDLSAPAQQAQHTSG